jgi:hypothetical protein
MAEELVSPEDDAALRGAAPARTASSVTVATSDTTGGSGQKTSRSGESSPTSTFYRRVNPLDYFSSFTYNLSLYMTTPECMNYYLNNGKLPDSQGQRQLFIVAQSGGVNKNEARAITTSLNGPIGPGQDGLDYYIDDLNIEQFLVAKDGQKTSTVGTTINFKVVEPIGFSFLTRLTAASEQINKLSGLINSGDLSSRPNLYQQCYMIGIRFYGYDENGEIMESSKIQDSTQVLNDKFAVYERIFPIIGTKVHFKLDGKATVYNWEAVILPLQTAFGTKFGRITESASLEGTTVSDVVGQGEDTTKSSLMGWLNSHQETLLNEKKINKKTKYSVSWDFENKFFDAKAIKNSLIIDDDDFARETSAMAPVKTVQDSNVKVSEKATSSNQRSKIISVNSGLSIPQVIDNIIVKSQYVVGEILKKNNQKIQTENNPETVTKLTWFTISPTVEIIGRDQTTNDWTYKITYQILPYEVPYLRSQYVGARSKYYGPIKEYQYLLTGKNTAVISFEQEYNNLFYILTPASVNADNSAQQDSKNVETPTHSGGAPRSDPTGGEINNGAVIAESVKSNLYSIADQAVANMKIMGDPDFLMDSIGKKVESNTFSKFYGGNGSLNPYGGQMFVEIIFKTAEDYTNEGTLDLSKNQSILFYPKTTQEQLRNNGLIYQVNKVTSSFLKGKFEQNLELIYVPPSQLITGTTASAAKETREAPTNTTAPQSQTAPVFREDTAFALANAAYETDARTSDTQQAEVPVDKADLTIGNTPAASLNNPLQKLGYVTNIKLGTSTDDDSNVAAANVLNIAQADLAREITVPVISVTPPPGA